MDSTTTKCDSTLLNVTLEASRTAEMDWESLALQYPSSIIFLDSHLASGLVGWEWPLKLWAFWETRGKTTIIKNLTILIVSKNQFFKKAPHSFTHLPVCISWKLSHIVCYLEQTWNLCVKVGTWKVASWVLHDIGRSPCSRMKPEFDSWATRYK